MRPVTVPITPKLVDGVLLSSDGSTRLAPAAPTSLSLLGIGAAGSGAQTIGMPAVVLAGPRGAEQRDKSGRRPSSASHCSVKVPKQATYLNEYRRVVPVWRTICYKNLMYRSIAFLLIKKGEKEEREIARKKKEEKKKKTARKKKRKRRRKRSKKSKRRRKKGKRKRRNKGEREKT